MFKFVYNVIRIFPHCKGYYMSSERLGYETSNLIRGSADVRNKTAENKGRFINFMKSIESSTVSNRRNDHVLHLVTE